MSSAQQSFSQGQAHGETQVKPFSNIFLSLKIIDYVK